ncbi:WD40-repeat-containing domain protein [Kockovaella imperatae]|uniref:WD40-repeat-containing domain protein n=1 Tax=Kockovaella imperatae TaxID=4999 RepID=A0A1Y1UGH5_9TREE|nr:WD40-repeat-containing domain protein [Kockovaella imperatae]ORX37128.1 WD40-repeat-containing domain protein [Kockovaella imperatae]
MELYIPPPSSFLPRLPPPRPVVPAVPVVPVPELPEKVHAPEGAYTLNASLFPSIGTPAAPMAYDPRTLGGGPPFVGAAGGFMVPPGINSLPPQAGQTAMSFGSTVVNGQTQPAWPVKMTFIPIYFAPKGFGAGGGGGGIGGGGGVGGGGGTQVTSPTNGVNHAGMYEPSVSSDSSDPTSSDNVVVPPTPMEVPLSAIPQAQPGKRNINIFAKNANVSNTLPRPKNNLRSSNSTFVTRLQTMDNLPKVLAERGRGSAGEMVRWGFWNLGRTFGWAEEGGKYKEAFSRVTFSQVPTCHTVSPFTASPDRLDIIVGFASGDLVWLDFIAGRYSRINKGGILNNTAVSSVHFDPRHPHHFIASFADSTILQFNMFAEDPVLPPANSTTPMPWTTQFERQEEQQSQGERTSTPLPGSRLANEHPELEKIASDNEPQSTAAPQAGPTGMTNSRQVYVEWVEKLLAWKNEDFGSLAELSKMKKGEERGTWVGKNPIAAFKVVKQGLSSLAYSPDGRYLAAVAEDGMLRLVDVAEEKLTDVFGGYFGALNCVAWSPDSRFIAVGGQDDLITIYSARETRVVARCQGHSAFVTNIAFDYSRGGGYRFGSVGEDGKLVLWDFTAAQLHRPRHHTHHSNLSHHRIPGSTISLNTQVHGMGVEIQGTRYHEAPPRSEVADLQPVMARMVEGNLLTVIAFTPSAIFTVSRAAQLKIWQRPPRQIMNPTRQRQKSAQSQNTQGGGGTPGTPGGMRTTRGGGDVAVAA